MAHPTPEGWKGGSDDFTFVRTLDGHMTGPKDGDWEDDQIKDADMRRNARTTKDAWLGGDYEVGG